MAIIPKDLKLLIKNNYKILFVMLLKAINIFVHVHCNIKNE